MKPPTAGERLKREIHAARARAGIASDMELAQRSHVHYDTLMNWYSGRTVPRPGAVRQIAETLDVRFAVLMDAYEGKDAEPPELKEAIAILVDEIRSSLVEERRARAQLMRVITAAITSAMEPVGVMDPEAVSVPITLTRAR